MANAELELLSNIIRDGDLAPIRRMGFNAAHLQTEEGREMFRWISDSFSDPKAPGIVPTLERVRRRFPDFDYHPSRDPVEALAKEVMDANVAATIRETIEEIEHLLDDGEDPQLVLGGLLPTLRDLSTQGSGNRHTSISSSAKVLREEYEQMQRAGGITGIPYPWAPLNQSTAGLQNEQFVVIYARPKSLKCIPYGQRVVAHDGSLLPIEQFIGPAPSYTASTGRMRWASAQVVESGVKECVRVTTESGRELESSTKHYYMVPEGPFEGCYERIENLRVGDWIGLARTVPEWEPTSALTADLGWLLGVLQGDGGLTHGVRLSNKDEELLDRVDAILARTFPGLQLRKTGRSEGVDYDITRGQVGGSGENSLLAWLKALGLHGKKSLDKDVPECVYTASKEAIIGFLAGLLDTDGTVRTTAPGRCVKWYSGSKELSRGVQHLLERIGVRASLQRTRSMSGNWAYSVTVYDGEQHQTLLKVLGPQVTVKYKRRALEQNALPRFIKKNTDGIPYSRRLMDMIMTAKGQNYWPFPKERGFTVGKLFRRSGKISRKLLRELADAWDSRDLRAEADNDVVWERIASIENIGERPCADICITDGQDPDFAVEGFLVHNTWVGIAICVYAYLAGYRVLVYSKEMDTRTMMRRAASIIAKIDYAELKTGGLSEDDEDTFFGTLEHLDLREKEGAIDGRRAAMHFISDRDISSRGKGGVTVEILSAEAERFGADLVLVDGFYLMRDGRTGVKSRDWKQVGNVSSDIKEMAQNLGIPVIGTTQANRGASKTVGDDVDEIGYADAIGQDADLVIRVHKSKNLATGKPKLMFTFPGTRDSVMNPFVINAWPGKDFSLLQSTVDVDAFLKDKKDSDAEEEGKTPGGGGNGSAGGRPASGRMGARPKVSTRIRE